MATAAAPAARADAPLPLPLAHLSELIPAYPQAPFLAMGDKLSIDGLGREMAYATTPAAPYDVVRYYSQQFHAQGLQVRQMGVGDDITLSATSPRDLYIRSVVTTRVNQRTFLLAHISHVAGTPISSQTALPPGCEAVQQSASVDKGLVSRLLLLHCEGYLRDITHFYDRQLADAERIEPWPDAHAAASYITYQASGRVVSLAAAQTQQAPPQTVATLSWQETP